MINSKLFPVSTKAERAKVKAALAEYHRMRTYMADYEQQGLDTLAPEQRQQYDLYKQTTADLKRAVDLILDEEERNIVTFRYVLGNRHKLTVLRWRSIMDERTVDRRLQTGIVSVANTLKLWGKL